jgi:membrane-bound lytic murein transglycosylase A
MHSTADFPGPLGDPAAALRRAAESPEAARGFFEANFRPVRISRLGEAKGFLTGYYEPVVQGFRFI